MVKSSSKCIVDDFTIVLEYCDIVKRMNIIYLCHDNHKMITNMVQF